MRARVIVVLGYREFAVDGSHGISDICRAGVGRAEALADQRTPRAVVFTGWSSTGGPSEAEQMANVWSGRTDVPLICEPHAVNTAENAVRTIEVLRGLDGPLDVIVVCSIHHFLRARYFFTALFRRHGHRVGYAYVCSPRPSARLWRHELGSITRMIRDRRTALELLRETPSTATAPLSESA
jgi:uncharacterized SAM-binding protein YcdF (DUF218 family)